MLAKKEKEAETGGGEINAFLGMGSDFSGKLTFDGTVRLDGKYSGEIFSNGILVIGETAKVQADIEVETLILSGELKGNISAKGRVEIHAPGKLYGNINSPVVVIDEGVTFEGNCSMKKKDDKKISILERKEEEKSA